MRENCHRLFWNKNLLSNKLIKFFLPSAIVIAIPVLLTSVLPVNLEKRLFEYIDKIDGNKTVQF
jgi:hypothetical protein